MDSLEHRLIAHRSEFQQAVSELVAALPDADCRELWFSDANFGDWPLNQPALVDALVRWAKPHRKLVLLASQFEVLARSHPRWVNFRRQFAHVVDCRVVQDSDAPTIPCMLLAPPLGVVRLREPLRWRGSVSGEQADLLRARDDIDAYLQRSSEAFPATTLGL